MNGSAAMKRTKSMYHHASKSRIERINVIQNILNKEEMPTIQTVGNGTLDNFEEQHMEANTGNRGRKDPKNRFIIHIKETWPTYLISIIGLSAFFFFVTFNIKIAEINKDISFLNTRLDDNTRKIEKISDEMDSLKENMVLFQSGLKSLDNRFALFIELFRQGGNNTLPDEKN
jgi:hypothetical protein